MRTIAKRATALFMALITMLSLFTTAAFADWSASFGGAGSGGNVGGGYWNESMQGIRITILTQTGEPAFYFGDGNPEVYYLDILYSDKNTSGIDYMLGGCKAESAITGKSMYEYNKANGLGLIYNNSTPGKDVMGPGNLAARQGTKACIVSFAWYKNWLGAGSAGPGAARWISLAPTPTSGSAIRANFNNIANTLPIVDLGTWQRNGEKIGNWLYNSDPDAKKPADTAAIHLMFNIYTATSSGGYDHPIWHLTPAGEAAVGAVVAEAYDPSGQTISDRANSGQHIYRTTELMELGNMAIVVEPIIWAELRNYGGQRSGCMIYGTPTNIADAIRENVEAGNWYTRGWQQGGWDASLHRASRSSFVLSKDIEYGGVTFKKPWDTDTTKPDTDDPRINQKDLGYAVHIYVCGSDDGTHTWDNNKYPDSSTFVEHPAPDPAVDPPTAGKYPSDKDKCIYRIVKVYDKEVLTDGVGKTIEHVATYVREKTYSKIEIQDEIEAGGYEVVNWKISDTYDPNLVQGTKEEGSTPWTDPIIQGATPVDASTVPTGASTGTDATTPGKVDIQNTSDPTKERTLYVELRKKIEIPETHTWDEPNYPGPTPNPGPAPDPTKPEHEPKPYPEDNPYLNFRIVKVYQEENEDDGTITHVATTTRNDTAPIITITGEGSGKTKWELIEWKYADGTPTVTSSTDWDDSPISTVSPINSGKTECQVNIMDETDPKKERTLYVLLRRKISTQTVPGDIIIQQSQISKAVHTDDKVIGGRWGNYSFVATIGDFTRTHSAHYDHGCCQKRYGTDSDGNTYVIHDCGKCHGHTCYLEMPGRDGDNKLTYVFDQIGAEVSLQVKTGVHSSTDPKVYTPNGVHPKTIPGMYASGNVEEFVSDGNQKNGAELVTVLWRGGATPTDIPTLALYKKNDITNRYGSTNYEIPQAMLKNASNKSKKTRADAPSVYSLSIKFGIDQGASDLNGTASCVTHNGYDCIYKDTRRVYMISGTQFDYDFNAQVGIQFYAGAPKGLAAAPFGGESTSVMKQSTGNHFENNIIQGKQTINFFPYIKMTYMTNSLKLAELEEQNKDTYVQKTRYETYVLSEWESSILPSDAVEVGWTNGNEKESILMTSQQWSLHQKAVNGGQSWNGTNQVLPGGAIYQLSTPNDRHTNVKIVTYQTVVDQKTRQYLSQALTGTEYTEKQVAKDHTDFVNDAKEILDNLRIVQWVNKDVDDTYAWNDNWDEIPGSGALCVRGGGESLSELGLTGKSSTEAKYYMHKAGNLISYQSAELGDKTADLIGDGETASEGDLDIISINQVTTVFKVFTDTAGNVYMASVQQNGTDNEAIITSLVNQLKDVNADTVAMGQTGGASISVLADKTVTGAAINGVLSGDAKQIDDRTSFITNIVSSLTRNKGKDKTAAWSTTDGKWYNEAFDGIYLVRQAATLEIGLAYSSQRTSALDPALCPPNAGQSDLYSKAFLSQFCLNDQSDAAIAADKDERYLGTFKGKDITLPDMEGMYQSRKFYIPNANVQDLN